MNIPSTIAAYDETELLTYLLTYLLMELSASWEAANYAATQELPTTLWKP
jgi:hypothetical protein